MPETNSLIFPLKLGFSEAPEIVPPAQGPMGPRGPETRPGRKTMGSAGKHIPQTIPAVRAASLQILRGEYRSSEPELISLVTPSLEAVARGPASLSGRSPGEGGAGVLPGGTGWAEGPAPGPGVALGS